MTATSPHVLDASAVLAWLQREPGADVVDPLLAGGIVTAVNWSEILQKIGQKGRDSRQVGDLLQALGVRVEPVIEEDGVTAASLWFAAPFLSIADRCCLALAQRLNLPTVTAERSWSIAGLAQQVVVIR